MHDNFFDLGGDSIVAIQIVALANRAGLKLTAGQLFEAPTIEELSRQVTNVQTSSDRSEPFQRRATENESSLESLDRSERVYFPNPCTWRCSPLNAARRFPHQGLLRTRQFRR